MGEERACDGSSKRVESGRKGEITQQCLKFAIEKWLNDGYVEINGKNLPRRFEIRVAKKKRGGKN